MVFSAYHHICTNSSVHSAVNGNDTHSPVSLKCVTGHCLVPRDLCSHLYIHAVGQGHGYYVTAHCYNEVMESSPGDKSSTGVLLSP